MSEHYRCGDFQAWDVTRYMSGNLAQAWQYIFRCGQKGELQDSIHDLRKAIDFLEDYIAHPEIPPSLCPHEIRQYEGSNHFMSAMLDVPSRKAKFLFEIHSAAFFVGKNDAGGQFDGRALLKNVTIPRLLREIEHMEAANV